MTLANELDRFVKAVGAQIKATRAMIGNLSLLSTTAKGDLVSAVNEVKQSVPVGAATQTNIDSAVAKAVKVDSAQSFTAGEKTQGRSNIAAVGTGDIGPTDTDYVAVFNAALAG